MSWTHHSDKWTRLTAIEMADGRQALKVLDSYPVSSIEDQKAALETIAQKLKDKPHLDLAGDVLHAATHGFIRMALNEAYDGSSVSDLLVTTFQQVGASKLPYYDGLKKSLIRTAFGEAVQGETQSNKARAIVLLEKLHEVDPASIQEVLEDQIYPQEWDTKVSLADNIRSYDLRL